MIRIGEVARGAGITWPHYTVPPADRQPLTAYDRKDTGQKQTAALVSALPQPEWNLGLDDGPGTIGGRWELTPLCSTSSCCARVLRLESVKKA
ncbi:MAG: hypothetical protein ACJ736_12375 [Streptomyces sp.]